MNFCKNGIIILFSLSLAGCSQHLQFTHILPPLGGDKDIEQQDAPVADDAELELSDTDVCLDAELSALSQSGVWNGSAPQVSQKSSDNVRFDFPIVINNQVEMYLSLFQNGLRKQFERWLARSSTYLPMIQAHLEQAGLPKDLAYLAMIESGFNAKALSRSNAVGLWQFMRATGRQYDLTIDKYVDERRDPEKSTVAAVNYLADLYHEFNDWHLAVAAYNGGPGTIRNGLRKHKSDNFWDLAEKRHLCLETKRYVPKLIATLLIAKEPERYGFNNIKYAQPLDYETISVGPGMSLEAIALISNSSLNQIKGLNQELRYDKTPLNVSQYEAKIPKNSFAIAEKNIDRLHSIVQTGYKTHTIAKGDTLNRICSRYNINKTTLLKVNNLHSSKLPIGQNLRIPYNTITYQLLPEGSPSALAAYKDSLILHKIKKGDTVSKIARQYNVPAEMIVAWNGLKSVNSIRAGQQLALFIDQGGKLTKNSRNNKLNSSNTPRIVAAQKKQLQPDTESAFLFYDVQDGDSLWTISRKFSASTADIKKWNNLKTNIIFPGNKLKLKKG